VAQIELQLATSRHGVPHARTLKKWALAALPSKKYSVCIRIVGNAESRKLNRQWRGKDKPTNVLSFPAGFTRHASRITRHVLGDLAICAPVVAQEARDQGKSLHAHWAHMIVHGILHLLGYDHIAARDAKRMESLEVEILRGLGFTDPYVSS